MRSIWSKLHNYMYIDVNSGTEGEHSYIYRDVVINDCYKIQELSKKFLQIKTIVDLGANVGMFSLLARSLYPWTDIIALEPFPDTFKRLQQNTDSIQVTLLPNAYGDGKPVDLFFRGFDGLNNVVSGGSQVKSTTLKNLSSLLRKPYMIKSDCEGAEFNFFDGEDFDIIKEAALIAMEAHFTSDGIFNSIPFFNFVNKLLPTHNVLKVPDNSTAVGDFVAVRKDAVYG